MAYLLQCPLGLRSLHPTVVDTAVRERRNGDWRQCIAEYVGVQSTRNQVSGLRVRYDPSQTSGSWKHGLTGMWLRSDGQKS
jgi:hypothetical protein